MSKIDAQRAIREARYALNRASGPSRREEAASTRTPSTQAAPTPKTKPTRAAVADAAAERAELCGHKSMNGRICTREAAHSQKSHRYS